VQRHTKHCILLGALITIILALCFVVKGEDKQERRYIRILAKDPQTNGRAIMPMVAPIVFVRQIAGPELPEDKGSTACHWSQTIENGKPVIVGDCDQGVKLVVTGLDLNY
jgi:hypothetical protein